MIARQAVLRRGLQQAAQAPSAAGVSRCCPPVHAPVCSNVCRNTQSAAACRSTRLRAAPPYDLSKGQAPQALKASRCSFQPSQLLDTGHLRCLNSISCSSSSRADLLRRAVGACAAVNFTPAALSGPIIQGTYLSGLVDDGSSRSHGGGDVSGLRVWDCLELPHTLSTRPHRATITSSSRAYSSCSAPVAVTITSSSNRRSSSSIQDRAVRPLRLGRNMRVMTTAALDAPADMRTIICSSSNNSSISKLLSSRSPMASIPSLSSSSSSSSRVSELFRLGRGMSVVTQASRARGSSSGDGVDGDYATRYRNEVFKELKTEEMIIFPEERLFWQEQIDKCRKQSTIRASAFLDWDWKTGIRPFFDPAVRKSPNCFKFMVAGKYHYPNAIILVRIGKFYEAAGFDAVMLVEHCGLNFMGRPDSLQAGLPVENLHMNLKQLVREAGFEVAIVEELGETSSGNSKQRDFVQLVTPENPQYLYNFAESMGDVDIEAPAICGLAATTRGWVVFQYVYATNSIMVHEGLTLDGVWGYINADRSTKPVVYLYRPTAGGKSKDTADPRKHIGKDTVTWRVYQHVDPLEGFKLALLKSKGLDADTELPHKRFDWSSGGMSGVRALYQTTAAQLGLTDRVQGVPSLVDALLPEGCRKVVRDTLTGLLTSPPPYAVAAAVRSATRMLMSYDQPLPYFSERGVTPQKAMLVLNAMEASAGFFQALIADLCPVIDVLQSSRSPEAAALVSAVWPLLLHTTDSTPGQLTQEQVLAAAEHAVKRITSIVADSDNVSSSTGSSSTDKETSEQPMLPLTRRKGSKSPGLDLTRGGAWAAAGLATDQLGAVVETWERRVRPTAIEQFMQPFLDAAYHLQGVAAALLWAAYQAADKANISLKANCPSIAVDTNSGTLWLRIPSDALRKVLVGTPLNLKFRTADCNVDAPGQVLRAPAGDGRRVKGKGDTFTCDELDAALARYLATSTAVNSAATAALKQLVAELATDKVQLAAALQLGILLTTLLEHSSQAGKAGWTVPLVGSTEQQYSSGGSSSKHPEHDGVLDLHGLWPYWMSKDGYKTVKNDVRLDGFMLLTGPNMAGKSTVLRSVAAAALAGSVGLAIPAAAGSRLPLLDAIILRTFSGDAPQEALSAYGVEMKEMATVLSDARPSSLVLVDELGKGTEVVSGTAIAGSILRSLATKGAMGVFATHLHLLVELLQDNPHIQQYKMEVVDADTGCDGGDLFRLRPTWRLLPGTCFESLAFSVARDCGLPPEVMQSAMADYHRILQGGLSSSSSSSKAADQHRSAPAQAAYASIVAIACRLKSPHQGSSSSSSNMDTAGVGNGQDAQQQQRQQQAATEASEGGDLYGWKGEKGSKSDTGLFSDTNTDAEGWQGEVEQMGLEAAAEEDMFGRMQQANRKTYEIGDPDDWGEGDDDGSYGFGDVSWLGGRFDRLAQALQDSSSSRGSSESIQREGEANVADARAYAQGLFQQLGNLLLYATPPEGELAAAAEAGAGVEVKFEAAVVGETGAAAIQQESAAAVEAEAAGGRRRRRRSPIRQEPQGLGNQLPQQSTARAAAAAEAAATAARGKQTAAAAKGAAAEQQTAPRGAGSLEYGVVHELRARMQPPPAHEGQPVLYMLRGEDNWWYGGETQEIRKRLAKHRQKFGKGLTMWYVLVAPEVNRKVVQGRMILLAEKMGLRLLSNRDASMARGK